MFAVAPEVQIVEGQIESGEAVEAGAVGGLSRREPFSEHLSAAVELVAADDDDKLQSHDRDGYGLFQSGSTDQIFTLLLTHNHTCSCCCHRVIDCMIDQSQSDVLTYRSVVLVFIVLIIFPLAVLRQCRHTLIHIQLCCVIVISCFFRRSIVGVFRVLG